MHRSSAALAALLALVTAPRAHGAEEPPSDELARGWERLDRARLAAIEDDRRLMWGLLGASLASTAVGAGLMVTDARDQGLRVAGAVTVGFALIDIALAAPALAGNREARETWTRARTEGQAGGAAALRRAEVDFAREQGQVAWVFALNLGLDAGYVMAGAAAAASSAFGVEHPDRWLGGGLATVAQGLLLIAIDTVGFTRARGYQSAALDALGGMALVPTVGLSASGQTMTLGLAGRF